jgi:hypothetical protein
LHDKLLFVYTSKMRRTYNGMNQKIEKLSVREKEWIASQLQGATKLIAIYAPSESSDELSLSALDHAFAAWISGNEGNAEMINAVINRIGVAFGQSLVDGLGLEWVIATDERGNDLAVYGLPEKGDVLVYPANFVAKRWEQRETNFLQASYDKIAQQIKLLK